MAADAQYGWAELCLMWELGRQFERARHEDAALEVRASGRAPRLPQPRAEWVAAQLAREERIAGELLEMEQAAQLVRAQIDAEAAGQPRRPWTTTEGVGRR